MYARKKWLDQVQQYARRFTSVINTDGSRTDTPVTGEVIQAGTPQSSTNFNQIEEALQHHSIAFDLLWVTNQAELRAQEARITAAEARLTAHSI
ncbi:MAG: hypothetical protein LLF96_07435 [Eubacteriales bacterium]|nr:hypothetical protein [Eubacteriales bacterium]